jgi:hypothetical protein
LSNGEKINVRLLNISDEIEAQEFESKNGNSVVFRCAKSMVDNNNILDKIERLNGGSTKDTAIIRAFHDDFYHGPNMNAKFKCKCKEEDRVEVPFRFDYIYPRNDVLTRNFGKGVSS